MFLTCFVVFCKIYFVDTQLDEIFNEKKIKKVFAGKGKGSTFAPAKRKRGVVNGASFCVL